MDCNCLIAYNSAVTSVWDDTGSIRGEAGEEALKDKNGIWLIVGNRRACIGIRKELSLSTLCSELLADVLCVSLVWRPLSSVGVFQRI